MEASQEWCLQCGAGVPGSLATRSPSWRATATVITATPTPKSTATPKTTSTPTTSTPAPSTPKTSAPSGGGTKTEPQLTPVLLDANAVTTYNPMGYPPEDFGNPALAIDGDTATAWTARVDPAIAPKMAAGLVIDMGSPQKLAALELITSTPGMTVQVFGANGTALPAAITDPGWVALSALAVEKERNERIKLDKSTAAFRFVVLWISGVPSASVGTPAAPGSVSVNELEALLAA
jgi:hypothetical protein